MAQECTISQWSAEIMLRLRVDLCAAARFETSLRDDSRGATIAAYVAGSRDENGENGHRCRCHEDEREPACESDAFA